MSTGTTKKPPSATRQGKHRRTVSITPPERVRPSAVPLPVSDIKNPAHRPAVPVHRDLTPARVPQQQTAAIVSGLNGTSPESAIAALTSGDSLQKIHGLLKSRTGHDFSHYKVKPVCRSILRRMARHQIEGIDTYHSYLRKNPRETDALFDELLIGVTTFFRDNNAFAALAARFVPDFFKGREEGGAALRIWIPGCSSGEEAYSIAMLLQEQMNKLGQCFAIQIFATDIDLRALEIARAGIYSSELVAAVPERIRPLFFDHHDKSSVYRVKKQIRDMLCFSEHNVIRDPPFPRLDMISCRNLFIYLGGSLQKKLIPLFHNALNPGGTLFLGNADSIGDFQHLFSASDQTIKIYTRISEPPAVCTDAVYRAP